MPRVPKIPTETMFKAKNMGGDWIRYDTVLSIDVGSKLGWALWHKSYDKPIDYGLLDTSKLVIQKKFIAVDKFMHDLLCVRPNTLIVYEKPHCGKFQLAIEVLHGMVGILILNAMKHYCPLYQVSPKAIKKYWTGNGNASKEEMVAQTLRGDVAPDCKDHNVSDAVAIGHFFTHRILPSLDKKGGKE